MLAWRRTSLSVLVAALLISRLALEESTRGIVVVGLAVVVVAFWAVLVTFRGGRASVASTQEPEFVFLLRDGVLPAAIAVGIGVLCLVELALAISR